MTQPKSRPVPAQIVRGTVDTFASKLQKKLLERDRDLSVVQQLSLARQSRILKAMTIIRRALQDTTKIKIDSRYQLELEISDREGWPRLDLRLNDIDCDMQPNVALIVTAHDRDASGTITLALADGLTLGALSLVNDAEFDRLSSIITRSVRVFLELVSTTVLAPEIENKKEPPIPVPQVENAEIIDHSLRSQNVFSEDVATSDTNRVDIAEIAPGISID